MKNISLPDYTIEERKEIFKNLKKGDTFYSIGFDSWRLRWYVVEKEVKNVTPKGNVRLISGELIKDFLYGYYLKDEKTKEFIESVRISNRLSKEIDFFRYNQSEVLRIIEKKDAEIINNILTKYRREIEGKEKE